jgi:hypothetical protein
MKTIMTILVAMFALNANATGMKRTLMSCRGGSGEFAASFTLNLISHSPPGGPVSKYYTASASSSWLGGTHASGEVIVQKIEMKNAGTNKAKKFRYVNKEAGFVMGVVQTADVIQIQGSFIDPRTKMKGTITPRRLRCR